jgi:alpha-L-fucosidase
MDTFAALGKWMTVNAEAIRGTTASPHGKPSFDGRFTRKGAVTYAHVFKRPDDGRLTVPFKVGTAKLLGGGPALKVTGGDKESVIELPDTLPDPIATVIRCE